MYGHGGQPLICFPSSNGRTRDWEGFGMVDCVADLIDAGRLFMVAVDGIDWQSWSNKNAPVEHKARRHNDYYRYVTDEVVPFVAARPARTACGRPAAAWARFTRPTSSSAGRISSTG